MDPAETVKQPLVEAAIDISQTPLLDQKEEQKTKLPFCIFLLSNGAVGTLSARR